MPKSITILSELEGSERLELEIAGGVLIAFTQRAPEKPTVNEDTVGVCELSESTAVIAVADGAGGMPAGKKASQTAVETLLGSIDMSTSESLLGAMISALELANQAVLSMLNGSATTLTVATIESGVLRHFQIGDSESLLVGQRGKLKAWTTPHSPTGFAVEAGYLEERAALFHPDRHLVTNFVGTATMTIDVGGEHELRPLDTLLLASDGLTDNLYRAEIIESIRKGPLDKTMDDLLELSNRRMRSSGAGVPSKPDDLSIVLYRKKRKARRKAS